MMNSKHLMALIMLVLLTSLAFANLDRGELELIDGNELIRESDKVKEFCYNSKYAVFECSESKNLRDGIESLPGKDGEVKEELKPNGNLVLMVDKEGMHQYNKVLRIASKIADAKDASVYIHRDYFTESGRKIFHVDNLNKEPVDLMLKLDFSDLPVNNETQERLEPDFLMHFDKDTRFQGNYYRSDWVWDGSTVTFLARGISAESIGSDLFLVGSYALDDIIYNETGSIVNAANLALNGTGFGKVFNHGVATGGVTISDGAMVFSADGSDAKVSGLDVVDNTNPQSLGMWIKMNTNDDFGVTDQFRFLANTYLHISYRGSDIRLMTGQTTILQSASKTNYPFNEWNFVIGTWDGTTSRFYINGNLVGSSTTALIDGGVNVKAERFGSWSSTRELDGQIATVYRFNKEVSQAEITEIYNAGRHSYSPISNGLVGQWNGRATDWNGTNVSIVYDTQHLNAMTATIPNGSGVWAQPYNISRTAMSFDGVDDYVEFTSPFETGVKPFTISTWAYYEGVADQTRYLFWKGTGSGNAYHLEVRNGKLRWNPLNLGVQLVSNIDHPHNQWFFVTLTYDGTTLRMYQDGSSVGSSVQEINHTYTGTYTLSAKVGFNYWNGSLSDVRIYNTSLTAAEVYAIYSGQAISTPAIFVSNPNNGETIYNTDNVNLDIAVSGTAIDQVFYNINGTNVTLNSTSTLLNLAEGSYTMTVYVQNVLGEISSTTLSWIMGDVNVCEGTLNTLIKVLFGILMIVGIILFLITKIGGFESESLSFIWVIIVTIAVIVVTQMMIKVLAGAVC